MNKRSILTIFILFVLIASNVFSQEALKKGSYSLSGSISFSSGTNSARSNETDYLNFLITPGLTYFFIDYLSAGINLSYGYYENTWKSGTQEFKNIYRSVSIGPVIRYYFSSETFIPFLETSYRYSNSLSGNQDMNSYSLAGGINYFLSKSVALEPYAAYVKTNYIEDDQKISSISVGLRINYFIVD